MNNSRVLRNIARVLCVAVGCSAIMPAMVACKEEDNVKALVLATDVLDTVFNPFFYTSGSDGEIVGQTQIGMLSGDGAGQPLSSWDEPCVAFNHSIVKTGTDKDFIPPNNYSAWYTDYYFAIKDDIKFADGVSLTKHDVLFNIYMYLDPAYTGSSTMYSTKIDGLTEYRTQTPNINDASGADSEFNNAVESRFLAIETWISNNNATWDDLKDYEPYKDQVTGVTADKDKVIESDINKIQEYYKEYLDDVWRAALGANIQEEYVHKRYFDSNGNPIFTEPWQLFLYNTGIITLEEHRDSKGEIDYSIPHNAYDGKDHSQSALVNYVYNGKFADQKEASKTYKNNLLSTMYSYSVYVPMQEYLLADVKYRKFQGNMQVKKIRGIEILTNQTTIKKQAENGTVTEEKLKDKDGNERAFDVLHIRINGIDPKAIQNFSFTVAPGHYYSTKELWDAALKDETCSENFGVQFSNPDFMNSIRVKQLPLGAGPYRPAKSDGGYASNKGQFSRNNMVYLESNKYFMLGEPKIKRLRYKVISSKDLYTTITTTNEVHFASPSMKQAEVNALTTNNSVTSASVENLGYGYIGVSATYIPNIYIRKAIMMSFDPYLIKSYYGDGASVITRPMSKTLEYYYYNKDGSEPELYYKPNDLNSDGEISMEERQSSVRDLLLKGGCRVINNVMYDETGRNQLKYTFTIAGDSTDHPARQILNQSATILNNLGCDITVKNDSMALSKLSSGLLTVWAAAWSSSSDPDMYQVYHKDSQATSTTAWGFKYINSSRFTEPRYPSTSERYDQRKLLDDLAAEIEGGRKYDDKEQRKPYYDRAQNILMDLAVEYPTYQRKQYYVWKSGLFKEETLHLDEVTTYRSPLSRIWEVEMK